MAAGGQYVHRAVIRPALSAKIRGEDAADFGGGSALRPMPADDILFGTVVPHCVRLGESNRANEAAQCDECFHNVPRVAHHSKETEPVKPER